MSEISTAAELYILAVSDDAIPLVAKQLSSHLSHNALVVHTSGNTPSSILSDHFQHCGIFYPLQTFSIERQANFEQIPICIDSPHPKDLKLLEWVAQQISPKVYPITDEQRAILHLAAVFVNNFTNHLFYISEDILEQEQLPFDLLKPLIAETFAKIQTHRAKEVQTGPAIRGDVMSINRHLKYLESFPLIKLFIKV